MDGPPLLGVEDAALVAAAGWLLAAHGVPLVARAGLLRPFLWRPPRVGVRSLGCLPVWSSVQCLRLFGVGEGLPLATPVLVGLEAPTAIWWSSASSALIRLRRAA